jgi:hypothetical protein
MHSGGQGTVQILRGLANPPAGAVGVPTGSLEEALQSLNGLIRQNPGTTEAAAASLAKSKLDAFAASPPARSVVSGDVQPHLDQLQDARGNWAAAKRSGTLTGALDRAQGAAEAGNGDLASRLGQRANAILNSPRLSQGLTDADRSALEGIRSGTPLSGLARAASGGEGRTRWGAGLLGLEGYQQGGIPGAIAGGIAPWALSKGAQGASGYFAKNAMNAADTATRVNSPLFRQMVESGQSAAPVDVGPGTAAAQRLGSALINAGLSPLVQQQNGQ